MANLKLISPWRNYYNKVQAFFKEDQDVNVVFDEDNMDILVYVQTPYKAEALDYILKSEQTYGDTTVSITVVPANNDPDAKKYIKSICNDENYAHLYSLAFCRNSLYSDLQVIHGLLGFDAVYVVFDKRVVQYYIDNIGDLHGIKSTIAEDIARDIFVEKPGIFFCTDIYTKDERIEQLPAVTCCCGERVG